MEYITKFLVKDGFIVALFVSGVVLFLSSWISVALTRKKIPGAAIAIFGGLVLAYIGGAITNGKNGIADIGIFSGFAFMGGTVLRDFTIVATAMGARFSEIKRSGLTGIVSLFVGVIFSFLFGALIAKLMGFDDVKSITTIGAGACTFIVGPVTGTAVGASSEVIALSIAAGVVKSIFITICTPMIAKTIRLDTPAVAMIYGGLIGTTSGVAAGLAATDPKLVPYGAITATFYTGLGCLLCPSVLYLMMQWIF